MVSRYYSVPNPKASIQIRDDQQVQLWKVRTASLLDNELDFNEVFEMFESLGLLDYNLTPKVLCALYVQVTGQVGTMDHVHKNNVDNVMVLDEFLEMMMRVVRDSFRQPATHTCVHLPPCLRVRVQLIGHL